jgi:hypothetical protein
MIQCRQHLRLALEPRQAIRIEREGFGQNLQGHFTIQLAVAGSIHLAHAAGANERRDFIRAETSTCGQSHGMWLRL